MIRRPNHLNCVHSTTLNKNPKFELLQFGEELIPQLNTEHIFGPICAEKKKTFLWIQSSANCQVLNQFLGVEQSAAYIDSFLIFARPLHNDSAQSILCTITAICDTAFPYRNLQHTSHMISQGFPNIGPIMLDEVHLHLLSQQFGQVSRCLFVSQALTCFMAALIAQNRHS